MKPLMLVVRLVPSRLSRRPRCNLCLRPYTKRPTTHSRNLLSGVKASRGRPPSILSTRSSNLRSLTPLSRPCRTQTVPTRAEEPIPWLTLKTTCLICVLRLKRSSTFLTLSKPCSTMPDVTERSRAC